MAREAGSIDRIDRKILKVLQGDARITNARLSALVSLSPSACFERVRRLEKAGILAGYRAEIALDRLCRSVTVVATVQLGSHDQAAFQRFDAALKAAPEVVECVKVSGPFDYVLRLVCADMEAYNALSDKLLASGTPVAHIHSHIVLERTKPFAGYPLDKLL
jgi:DNA-binding Lrp family transcriptional regulator